MFGALSYSALSVSRFTHSSLEQCTFICLHFVYLKSMWTLCNLSPVFFFFVSRFISTSFTQYLWNQLQVLVKFHRKHSNTDLFYVWINWVKYVKRELTCKEKNLSRLHITQVCCSGWRWQSTFSSFIIFFFLMPWKLLLLIFFLNKMLNVKNRSKHFYLFFYISTKIYNAVCFIILCSDIKLTGYINLYDSMWESWTGRNNLSEFEYRYWKTDRKIAASEIFMYQVDFYAVCYRNKHVIQT